ncbi:MAG: Uncharacterized protein G01um1014107_8 [Parcubacteria group bacterium Gr01-1014_107]|nr:MAG: Uncharacterized protein G01um1014107_8 [Parcubacteria group bacterium Gr01-1014_107]
MFRRRAKFKSPRLLKRRRRGIISRLILYPLLLLSVFLGLSFLSSARFLLIEKVEVYGNQAVAEEDLRNLVEAELKGSFLGLFSKRNIFLYPKKLVEAKLVNQFERLSSVGISLKNFKILRVEVKEREAAAIWCRRRTSDEEEGRNKEKLSEIDEALSEECFFVDTLGFIFASSADSPGDSFLRYEGEISSASPVGSYFWERVDAKKVSDFLTSLKSLEVKPVEITKEDNDKVTVALNVNANLILNLKDNWQRAFENLVTLVSEPEFKKNNSGNLISPFAYIDLRFGNKLLYKLK